MIKGYQSQLMEVYEKIRNEEDRQLKQRKAEIKALYPEILDLDNDIQKLSLKLTMTILKKDITEDDINKIKDEITDLRAKKCELLVSHGYDPEYLNMHYKCNKCQDTGYIGTQKCECYKSKLVSLYYKDSELQDILKDNNFSNFDLDLFSPTKEIGKKYSPRANMKNTLDFIMKDFIPNFAHGSDNLLFYGTAGSGKTFLSYCIAKELLDRGFLVVYKTSDELIRCLRDIKFNNNSYLEKLLMDCDLLIIDDLGSEQLTDFTTTEFFNFLNKKLLKKKRMIISTNFPPLEIRKHYSERISSRLLGNFRLYTFYSDDLRIELNAPKK